MTELRIGVPNEKQRRFLLDRHRHIAYGGARGGGKSWAVRTKAKLLALRYDNCPKTLKEAVSKEDAEKIVNDLKEAGATAEIK